MTLIYAYQGRGITRDIVINDADGNAITPGAADLVRIRIMREGETPKFEITGGTPTANGSTLTTGASNRLRLDDADTDFAPGTYSLIIDFRDNSDSQEWKLVDKQVFYLEGE